jgi:uncharacterized membrane protein
MTWYLKIWTLVLKGLLLFMLPLMLVIFILEKAFLIIQKLIQPILTHLPQNGFFGIGLLTLFSFFILFLLTLIAGVWIEMKKVKTIIPFLEDKLLILIPGYTLLKSRVNEVLGDLDSNCKSVLVGENDEWKFGIEIERNENGYSMVFFPDPPDAKSGELKMIKSDLIKIIDVPLSNMTTLIKKYGLGSTSLIK